MTSERYTNVILTVIALLLVGLLYDRLSGPMSVRITGGIPSPLRVEHVDQAMKVQICDVSDKCADLHPVFDPTMPGGRMLRGLAVMPGR